MDKLNTKLEMEKLNTKDFSKFYTIMILMSHISSQNILRVHTKFNGFKIY